MSPIAKLHSFVFDCPEPAALAEFYQRIFGGTVVADGDDWVDLEIHGLATTLAFQESPGYVPPNWPGDDGAQQAHLDIRVDNLDEAHRALLEIGARFAADHETFRVYRDPVGHLFCTVRG
ncbi:VOC family protein [Leucobacter japonicus]|uniref:VOC family protein n=1 Tax=Leucobacter japonicus TaxID=1461259 RepID=UPI0006A7D6DC|nr:VOC family protein [Leucobacter japonicus]